MDFCRKFLCEDDGKIFFFIKTLILVCGNRTCKNYENWSADKVFMVTSVRKDMDSSTDGPHFNVPHYNAVFIITRPCYGSHYMSVASNTVHI